MRKRKQGWLSSDVTEKIFYKAGFLPDSIHLVNVADSVYKADGGLTLFDAKKGSVNFRDGKWLGYRKNRLEAIVYLKKAETISSVTISSVVDIGSYLMPPQMIEVWGGDHPSALRLLKQVKPEQPIKETPAYLTGYDVAFQPLKMRVLKIIVTPVPRLPPWHKGKGDKGWAFVDEIFLN